MLRKSLITAAVALLLTPALASAGMVYRGVATGSSSGTVTPSTNKYETGAVTLTFTAGSGMTLDKVKNNGATVTTTGTGPWTYQVPVRTYTQQVYGYFKQSAITYPTLLEPKLPTKVVLTSGVGTLVSGQQSVIRYMPITNPPTYAEYQFIGSTGITVSPSGWQPATYGSNSVVTTVTATQSGTLTLQLRGNSITSSTASAVVEVNGPGYVGSSSCLQCHTGWTQEVAYKASIHGAGAHSGHSTCESCHNPAGTVTHPYGVNTDSVSATTFQVNALYNITTAVGKLTAGQIFCTACHNGSYAIPHTTSGLSVTCNVCHTGGVGANGTGDAHAIKAVANIAIPAQADCAVCHSAFVGYWTGSVHQLNTNNCAFCHAKDGVAVTTLHGKVPSCDACHDAGTNAAFADPGKTCNTCHGSNYPHSVKDTVTAALKLECLDCHSVGQQHVGNFLNDNNGVRAVNGEFTKRSHHILNAGGAAPTSAQCAVCHLEGKAVGTAVRVDPLHHMADNKIHLRNADTGTGVFLWSGTEHTNMDNFCFSCHDSDGFNGLTASGLAPALPGTASASNPFGDTLTNSYDAVPRTGVVDVESAFNTANASHHAVSGQRYAYRFSTDANAAYWAAQTGNPLPASSEIAEHHVGEASPNGGVIEEFDPADLYVDHINTHEKGGEATLYEGGKFVATYFPLGASQNVADNSIIHCGDCHTVGQWKPNTSTNADGTSTGNVVIGAHGSANEYMLRNSLGTDALHNMLTYVCFNCHKAELQTANTTLWADQVHHDMFADSVAPVSGSALNPLGKYIPLWIPTWKAGWNALHPVVFAGQLSGYNTAHAVSAMHAQCQAGSSAAIGDVQRANSSWRPEQQAEYDYAGSPGATAALPTASTGTGYVGSATTGSNKGSGNLTGIGCTNCHNSGLRAGWGGIHGGNNSYTDGLGRAQMSYRFMPGMGNYRYAPPGGWDGKDTSDPSLLTINNPVYPGTPGSRNDQSVGFPGASGKPMGGCYTNKYTLGATDNDENVVSGVTWSACQHHGTSTAAPVKTPTSGGMPTTFRTTYGGGTTGNPTTFEPTIREATAGGTLVTRPLKY